MDPEGVPLVSGCLEPAHCLSHPREAAWVGQVGEIRRDPPPENCSTLK